MNMIALLCAAVTLSAAAERPVGKVAFCAAHGVKVWAFGIEPKDRPHDDPFFLAHPDARGPLNWNGNYANCASSPALLAEIEGQMARLFRAVPGLAGFINIANGERTTTCLSFAVATNDETPVRCPVCMTRRPWELYRDVAAAMVKGMRAGNPDARLLTWFYQPSSSASRGDWAHDARLRPAWAVLRQGRDYNNGGTTWARPDRPMFPEPRLNQHALTGDNVARLVIRTGGRAKRR